MISGGSQNSADEPIGLYRSGWQLTEFFRPFQAEVDLQSYSRLPATRQALLYLAFIDDQDRLRKVIERAVDPRDFVRQEEKHAAAIDYLNQFHAGG